MVKLPKFLDFSTENGLVLCKELDSARNNAELLYLIESQKIGCDAVFFRRFYKESTDEKPYHSEPSVCIFQKDDSFFNSKEHIELHAKLWSAGRNEVYVIQSKTRIEIYNSRKPAKVNNNELSLNELKLVGDAIDHFNDQRFSAHIFTKGLFWEQGDFYDKTKGQVFYQNKLEEENLPYHQLLTFLKQTRKHLKTSYAELTTESLDKLLIVCILIKFLEEIKNEDGSHSLSQIYEKLGVQTFAEALSIKGKSIDILEELGKKLNGKVFDYFIDKEENELNEVFQQRNTEIKSRLRQTDLSAIANFLLIRLNEHGELEVNPTTSQLKLDFGFSWKQYSFRHLPIELISSIYEHFLQEDAKEKKGEKEKGVVYTPPFLVNFLIDEAMPLEQFELFKNKQFKILDPSCGSGIFLVSAYKRLIQWWLISYFNTYKQLPEKYDPKVFQNILENNIYGVDIHKKATLISIFSLTIAFLDKLDPIALWENLNFKKLQENVKSANFFDWAIESKDKKRFFDLVIGNPPFNPIKGISKKDAVSEFQLAIFGVKSKDIPNGNLALKFLEGALFFGDKICLIIPSNVLLYSKDSQNYRNRLFTHYTIDTIYDFTHLRETLFVKKRHKGDNEDTKRIGRTPVVAILIENKPTANQLIKHIVLKRINGTEKKIRFEIDHYDIHKVRWAWAVDGTKQFVWKTNLLGGTRLFHLIYRLSLLPTLANFIQNKKEENDEWIYSSGYKIGGAGTKKSRADYLYLKNTIDSKSNYNDENFKFKITIENTELFEAPRPENLYQPPVLIIAEILGKKTIPMQLFEHYQPFNISFIGIHAPKSHKKELENIYERLSKNRHHSRLLQLYMLATSAKLLINKETAFVKEDLDLLPYPQDIEYLVPSYNENILIEDVLSFQRHLGKAITPQADGKILHFPVVSKQLKEFGEVYCNSLNELYEEFDTHGKSLKKVHPSDVFQTDNFTIFKFIYGKTIEDDTYQYQKGDLNELDVEYKNLIFNEKDNKSALYVRIARIYEHINGYDCIILVKPNATRYWLKSIALCDADDTYVDLKNAGF